MDDETNAARLLLFELGTWWWFTRLPHWLRLPGLWLLGWAAPRVPPAALEAIHDKDREEQNR